MTTPIKTSWKNSTKIMVGVVFAISRWLETLLEEKFLRPCSVHERTKKNIFCWDCCTSTCTHCFPPHRLHCLLQIRRYVYHDVIRLSDVQKSVDCSLVQVQHLVALKNGTITNKEQDHELHVQLPNGQKPVSLSALEDGQITPNSVLDSPIFLSGSTTGSFSGGGENNICTTTLV